MIVERAIRRRDTAMAQWQQIIAHRSTASPYPTVVSLSHLYDILQNPAEATLKHHFGLRINQEDGMAIDEVEDEPFISDSRTLSRFLLDRLLAVNETMQPSTWTGQDWEDFAGALITTGYQELRRRCRTPEGLFAEIDEERVMREVRPQYDLARDALPLPPGKHLTTLVLGEWRQRPHQKRLVPVPSCTFTPRLAATPATYNVQLAGTINDLWRVDDTVMLLATTNSAAQSVSEAQKRGVPRALLRPLLHVLALCALGSAAGDWGVPGLHYCIRLLTADAVMDFPLPTLTQEWARAYLDGLVATAMQLDNFHDLPYTAITDAKAGVYPHLTDDTTQDTTYSELLQGLIEEKLADDQYDSFRTYRSPLLEVIGVKVPADSADIVRARFRPLYKLLSGEEDI